MLPSLDGFDVTMGPEMMAAIKTESEDKPPAATPAYNPYSAPNGQASASSAGFGIRLAAFLVDAVWMAVLQVGVMFAGLGFSNLIASSAASGFGLIVVLFGWAIWGTTPGKRVFNLYVSTGASSAGIGFPRALARIVGYIASFATLGIGFLMIAFSKSNRGLHDLIAGTQVQRQ